MNLVYSITTQSENRKFPVGYTTAYRFGFNGKEMDDETYGEGNVYDYGFRIYNPRLARFLSVDPLTTEYPMLTPYQFAANMPIWAIDLDGLEGAKSTVKYIVRIFNVNPDGHEPLKQGETWTDKNSGRTWVAGETIVQEGDPDGATEIRYTDVNGGDVTTYWVTEPARPKLSKTDEKQTSVQGQKSPETPKEANTPAPVEEQSKIPPSGVSASKPKPSSVPKKDILSPSNKKPLGVKPPTVNAPTPPNVHMHPPRPTRIADVIVHIQSPQNPLSERFANAYKKSIERELKSHGYDQVNFKSTEFDVRGLKSENKLSDYHID